MVLEEQESLHQEVVEIHRVGLSATLGIMYVYLGHLGLLGIIERTLHEGMGQDEMVFCHRNLVAHAGRLIHLVVEAHLLDDTLHQRTGIALVVDREVGAIPYPLGLGPEDTREDGMERAHLQVDGLMLTYQSGNTLLHLACRLVGKCQGQDIPGFQSYLLHQIGNLIGQHTRFSGACTSNYK